MTLSQVETSYFIYLPDDVSLVDNFFDEVKRIYESITSTKKICLSILTDDRVNKSHWGYQNPKDFGVNSSNRLFVCRYLGGSLR